MEPGPRTRDGPATSGLAHWLGFVASGGIAFATDTGLLLLLTKVAGYGPFSSRAVSIPAAIVAGWLAHRTLTFRVTAPPSLAELLRYASLQSLSIAVNYALYAAILLLRPATEPLVALILSSAVAMVIAYLGMRLGVFRGR